MYTDSTGYSITLFAIALCKAIAIVVAVVVVLYVVSQNSADTNLDGTLDGVTDALDPIKEEIEDFSKAIARSILSTTVSISRAINAVKNKTGTYAIQFSDGKYYIGKGSPSRMYASAMRVGASNKVLPVSFRYEWASNDREAFKKEYMWMVDYGYVLEKEDKFYNLIWSPGRNYYFQDNKELYGNDHF